MLSRSDHFSDASRVNAEAQVELNTAFGRAALESARRVLELNLGVAKASMLEAEHHARELLSSRDTQELLALAIGQVQPTSRKAIAYACYLSGIAASTQSNFIELFSSQAGTSSKEAALLAAEVTKNAPPGWGRTIGLIRALFDHANAGYELFSLASKQMLSAMESSWVAAANQLALAARQGAATAKPA